MDGGKGGGEEGPGTEGLPGSSKGGQHMELANYTTGGCRSTLLLLELMLLDAPLPLPLPLPLSVFSRQ